MTAPHANSRSVVALSSEATQSDDDGMLLIVADVALVGDIAEVVGNHPHVVGPWRGRRSQGGTLGDRGAGPQRRRADTQQIVAGAAEVKEAVSTSASQRLESLSAWLTGGVSMNVCQALQSRPSLARTHSWSAVAPA